MNNEELEGLPDIKAYCQRAQQLKEEYLIEKVKFEAKEKEYNTFFQKEFPKVLYELDLKECTLTDGTKVCIKQKSSLSLTNEEKRNAVFNFLKENGGETLLSETVLVDPIYKESLTVPFETKLDANTNSVKAFLLSGLSEGLFELPPHFPMSIWNVCEVN